MAADELLPRNAEVSIGVRAVGIDDGVIVVVQFSWGEVLSDLDMAEESEAGLRGNALKDAGYRLDLRMVGRHAAAYQTERRGQPIEHVDANSCRGLLQRFCSVEAGGSGANDGDAQYRRRDTHGLPISTITLSIIAIIFGPPSVW